MSEVVEVRGCSATPCCDPRRAAHRFTVLIFICFLSFGSYFCFDNPAALQDQITKDMKTTSKSYMLLYSLYSWPNVILCFFGGFLIDRVFGIRLGTIIFSLFVCVGQIIFALGALLDHYWLMLAGRFVFGIGGESLAVAQNTYAVSWFKGAELNMVFGLQLSFSRVGSTVNMNVMGPLYKFMEKHIHHGEDYKILGWTLMTGFLFCLLSLFCGVMMAFFDKRAARLLKKNEAKTGEVIHLTDVKDFPLSVWLIFIICVAYYVAVFPFISLGLLYFQSKFNLEPTQANVVNSLVYLISAGASPVLGFFVDKVGNNIFNLILAITMTIGAHVLLTFTFLNPYVAMIIMGIGYSLLACALWPLVAMIVPEYQLGTAYGFMQSIQNLGLAVVSIIAGSIVDDRGYLILEIFFLACLSVALIAAVMLYLVDLSRGGQLNMSAWKRKTLGQVGDASVHGERKPLLEDYYTSPPPGTTNPALQPKSAAALRNRFLSKLGGPVFQPPDTFRTSPFVFPHVLR